MDIKVSACIIAKNEEKNLPRLLESIKGKFDEIVLVDTGSTDKTVEVAKSYGAKVYHREWNGFADARQYAVDVATGDWIWFFDADTELEEEEYERFKRILLFIKDHQEYEGIGTVYKNLGLDGNVKSLSSTVHIHKKHPDLVWEGKIHERVVNKKAGTILIPPMKVHVLHYGYAEFNTQIEKAKRNLRLLFDELKKYKDTKKEYYVNIFYIIQSYSVLASTIDLKKYSKKSIRYIKKFLNYKDNIPNISTFKKHFYVYAIRVYISLEDYQEAKKLLDEALKIDEFYPDYHYLFYTVYEAQKDTKKAVESLINFILSIDKSSKMYGIISDYITYKEKVISDLESKILSSEDKDYFKNILKDHWNKTKGENIGRVFFRIIKEENPKEALKVIKKVATIHQSSEAYSDLGEYYYKNKEMEDSLKNFLKAYELNLFNIKANKYLSYLYLSYKDYEKAFYHGLKYLNLSRDFDFINNLEIIAKLSQNPNLKESFENLKQKISQVVS
ncbi:tetratricopeptide repeat-containing glycosyltransferase family 2 protein [Sulfurihydrogenibium subterraneum]|uniref:tetratricopeptide repeat-containing glycosyltransferase family 2 protein n=1 Tax=Sulfurihydrogenibium subterraneum TaxID=171121 RepID=UPI00048AB0E2|nr:glycosyltransferase family 2 protein [Sulfurihydrogenibium subterraneum]